MTRVLVVEAGALRRTSDLLTTEGFTVVKAAEQQEAVETALALRPHMVVIEVESPHASSIAMVAALRAVTNALIAMVAGPCSEKDVVGAFTAGVDSLVVGPVGPHELLARLRAVLRRHPPAPEADSDVIVVGPVVLDRGRRELRVHDELIAVPRREFDIAELLMRDAGRVVARTAIASELWGSMRNTKSLEVQVGRLRARLAAAEGRRRIITIRGVGYRFATDDDLEIDLIAGGADEALDELEEPASA